MKLFSTDTTSRRTLGAVFAIAFTIAILLTAFFQTQVVSGAQYALRSEENRLRPIPIPAPRGSIVDRYGDIVGTSVTGYRVLLLPAAEETVRNTLVDLQPLLGLSGRDVERLIEKRNGRKNDLLTVTEDATFSQIAALEERRAGFPNVLVVERPKRYYPAGAAIGHLMGYVAEINKEELQIPEYSRAGYRQGRWIGKAGIEKEYELLLSGIDGARFVEVDAMGRIINPKSTVASQAPVPGDNLQLTVDIGLQEYVADIFPDTVKGALVAMVPSTGEILAMYSNPGYDPNDFVGGPTSRLWSALAQDSLKPMLHRAVAALYPPASTFKLATAVMGLQAGIINAGSTMPISCSGGMLYAGRYARCWYRAGHGQLDLVGAIANSCNVYFYQVGIQLGLKDVIDRGIRMGFTQETAIDLPGEKSGIYPTGVAWYKKRFGNEPTPSEVMYLAIGQGPNSQTVLKMAHFYSAMAGNGSAPPPRLVSRKFADKDTNEAGALNMSLSDGSLKAIWTGLAHVTDFEAEGTARLSALERWKLYGKTGTAQNPQGADHGWFAGFAGPPGETPEIAVAVIVEHGLHGSDVAPLAAKAANYYLNKKYKLPFDPKPTLIERWRDLRCPWDASCTVPNKAAAVSPVKPEFDRRGQQTNAPGMPAPAAD